MSGSPAPTIAELIERHSALLYRYAYRLSGSAADAEDLTQQAYLVAQQKLHQLREASAAKSWLCTILRNEYLRGCHQRPAELRLDQVREPLERDDESVVDEEALQQALQELTEEYRSAVVLYYFHELSYQEVAQALQIPLGTVMSRLSRGRSQLKSQLEAFDRRQAAPRLRSLEPVLLRR